MRIVGGKYRHRLITQPKTDLTRPTTDRVREALMSIINFSLRDATILDLFSGSGAFGIECLSRGAKKAYFNDVSKEAYNTIRKNLKDLNVDEEYEVFNFDYQTALNRLLDRNEKIDILFLDPPYKERNFYTNSIDFAIENLLNDNGIVIVENNEEFSDNRFVKIKHYHYGKIVLSVMYRR